MIASGARGAQPASDRPAEASANEGGAVGHADPWQALAEASTAELLCAAWLDLLCSTLVPAEAGMVLLAQTDPMKYASALIGRYKCQSKSAGRLCSWKR